MGACLAPISTAFLRLIGSLIVFSVACDGILMSENAGETRKAMVAECKGEDMRTLHMQSRLDNRSFIFRDTVPRNPTLFLSIFITNSCIC